MPFELEHKTILQKNNFFERILEKMLNKNFNTLKVLSTNKSNFQLENKQTHLGVINSRANVNKSRQVTSLSKKKKIIKNKKMGL